MVATAPPESPSLPATRRGGAVVFAAALLVTAVVRPDVLVGLLLLAVVLVPLERAVPLRRQRVRRPVLLTDLTHVLVNALPVAVATIVLVVVAALPLVPVRGLDLEAALPPAGSVALAVLVVLVGSYWGHRLTHQVPFLWRFHAVHHSTEQMYWVAAARQHPLDAAFTQACFAVPLFALGYDAVAFAGVTVFVTVLGIVQHANVRLRFPVLRWIVPTPEWHHWHHATDPDARDTNFGVPVIDQLFGTAFLPKGRRPAGFGVPDRVPADGYVAQLAYPFQRAAARS